MHERAFVCARSSPFGSVRHSRLDVQSDNIVFLSSFEVQSRSAPTQPPRRPEDPTVHDAAAASRDAPSPAVATPGALIDGGIEGSPVLPPPRFHEVWRPRTWGVSQSWQLGRARGYPVAGEILDTTNNHGVQLDMGLDASFRMVPASLT